MSLVWTKIEQRNKIHIYFYVRILWKNIWDFMSFWNANFFATTKSPKTYEIDITFSICNADGYNPGARLLTVWRTALLEPQDEISLHVGCESP